MGEKGNLLPTRSDSEDEMGDHCPDAGPPPSRATKIYAALFYGLSSLAIVFLNKIVLSTYDFPSVLFLALVQFASTAGVLATCARLGYVSLLPLTVPNLVDVLPLSACYLLNILAGLSATKELPLPMMVLLRRLSILFTMILERSLLDVTPSFAVRLSVGLMLGGALVAALGDLAFNAAGYVVIFFNDIFTALNGVLLKRASDEYRRDKLSVLFFNSVLSAAGVSVLLACKGGEIAKVWEFGQWVDPAFVAYFTTVAVMGSVLNYAIFLCTHANSALTTTVVGCLKNILTSYLGMIVGGDYVFSWLNFAGINISVVGSLIYAQATFRK